MTDSQTFDPIGTFISSARYTYELPRQAVLGGIEGKIELKSGLNFEQSVADLDGFSHIWVVFMFHDATGWNPQVQPPRSPDGRKVGVFASRSPRRPNPIGLSCLELCAVSGLTLHVGEADILDGSPILDIKPYLPYCDSFPDARIGWVPDDPSGEYTVKLTDAASVQIDWVEARTTLNLKNFLAIQLEHEPWGGGRKRIEKKEDGSFVIACRTWRMAYAVDEDAKTVFVNRIFSGYPDEDLVDGAPDPYADKQVHRDYRTNQVD